MKFGTEMDHKHGDLLYDLLIKNEVKHGIYQLVC